MNAIILNILRYLALLICIAFFAMIGYYLIIGFSSAGFNEDYTPGDSYPY